MRPTTIGLLGLGFLACGLALGAVGGCKDKGGGGGGGGNEIVIGEFASLTGPTATFGTSSNKGLRLAVKLANESGGVLGKQIRLVTEDDRSDVNDAVNAVQKLINQHKVVAVIGEVASKRSLAGANVCQRYKVPMLSPASTNPDVTFEGGKAKEYVFRICFTDDFQGKMNGRFAAEQGWKRVAVLTNVEEDYSKGLARFFKEAFTAGGGSVVSDETYTGADRDFKSQLTKIKSANPDAVYVPGYYGEVTLILPQAKQVGLNVPFFGGDGWDSAQTLDLPEAQGHFYSDHYTAEDPRPEVKEFVDAFRKEYKGETPDAMAVLGYDAGRVMIDAIKRAGEAAPEKIRAALEQTRDFKGASGTITIDEKHNARKPLVVLRIEDKKAKLFKTYQPE